MKLFKRSKEDKGAADTISFIMIIGFVMALLISFIDIGIYFNTKNEIQTAAENGARNVALYGGTDTDLRGSRSATPAEKIVADSIKTKYSTTVDNSGSVKPVVSVNSVSCGPNRAKAGDIVYCKVNYTYNGIAGKFSLFKIGSEGAKTVTGSAVSEVNMK